MDDVIASARELETDMIRIWPGNKASVDYTDAERAAAVDEALRFADLAAAANMRIGYEYHAKTLTDTMESAMQFLDETTHPAVTSFWQTTNGESMNYSLDTLRGVISRGCLSNIHVFHWVFSDDHREQLTLAEGEADWRVYLSEIAAVPGDRYCGLEFTRGGDPDQTVRDAAVLKQWISEIQSG
jgi:sugar phosphate isomerase/epimerase